MSGEAAPRSTARRQEAFRNEHFLDAAMGALALVTLADREIRPAEVSVLNSIVDEMRRARGIDPQRAFDLYRDYGEGLRSNFSLGRRKVLDVVALLAPDPHAARLLLELCVEVGKADRVFSQSEYAAIEEFARVLGLDLRDLE